MKRVLFICTHNSARSQMAEALVNHDLAERVKAFSAGTEPSSVHPLAVAVMRETGHRYFQPKVQGVGGICRPEVRLRYHPLQSGG